MPDTSASSQSTSNDRVFRIFGVEDSPFSVKVRSYFRYKGIPHQWVVRDAAAMDEFRRYARLPLIPLVVTPEDEALQDSTPLIETLEERFPKPPLQPADPALAFLSALMEEYADEWGNKAMFHYRWTREADQRAAAVRIARTMTGADEPPADAVEGVRRRMVPRLSFVGSSEKTAGLIEDSFARQLALVEAHLAARPFLFGGRPCLADLGAYAQIYEAGRDPTPAAILADHPRTRAWVERMLEPRAEGDFEAWEALEPTLAPLLAEEVAGRFLPWSDANARALAAGAEELRVELGGRPFAQTPQKYHAKSLGVLRRRYAAVSDKSRLDPILEKTGCLAWLRQDGEDGPAGSR